VSQTSQNRPAPTIRGALAREMRRRRGTWFGVAARLVAAIGVSAIIPQFFVVLTPPARQPDRTQSFAAAVRSFTAAVSHQRPSEDVPTPALAGFQSLLGSGNSGQAAEREPSENDPDEILQHFLRWRQKANPSEAAQ
jgi:hypothetical protein